MPSRELGLSQSGDARAGGWRLHQDVLLSVLRVPVFSIMCFSGHICMCPQEHTQGLVIPQRSPVSWYPFLGGLFLSYIKSSIEEQGEPFLVEIHASVLIENWELSFFLRL